MTYQNTATPSTVASVAHDVLGHVGGFFAYIGKAMMYSSTAHRRFEAIQALQSKTDEELAALNIKRDQIVHEVFKDLYYI